MIQQRLLDDPARRQIASVRAHIGPMVTQA
jgi:hypothetical protein